MEGVEAEQECTAEVERSGDNNTDRQAQGGVQHSEVRDYEYDHDIHSNGERHRWHYTTQKSTEVTR